MLMYIVMDLFALIDFISYNEHINQQYISK